MNGNAKALLIWAQRNRHMRDILKMMIGDEFPNLVLENVAKSEVVTADHVTDILKRKYDVIMLPLTLPNFNSLRMAEIIHQMNLPTRLLLYSRTNADESLLKPLFDGFERRSSPTPKLIKELMEHPVPKRLTESKDLVPRMKALLTADVWHGNPHGPEAASMAEYLQSAIPNVSGKKVESSVAALQRIIIINDQGKFVEQDHTKEIYVNKGVNEGIVGKGNKQEKVNTGEHRDAELIDLLKTMRHEFEKLRPAEADYMRSYVENIEIEAQKPKPNKGMLDLTRDGMVDAAKTCAEMAPSLLKAASAVVNWFVQNRST